MRETEPDVGIESNFADNLQLIVPNLHRRYSGVTATNRMVAPKLAKAFRAAWLGPDAPEGIARMRAADLAKLWRRRNSLIWHARRNNEMIVGVLLRSLGWPLKLVFTSAAQRHHTWITRWLIRRMDAIIATNDISASFLKREATVIPHGVDTDRYAPPADRAAAFAQAGLPGRYAIGCFGRVRAQKGSDVFVDAMCRLLPRYPDFTALMVGAITTEHLAFANDLRKRIEAAGLQSRIVITGELPIEDVQRWYQRLTIYAFTSRNEGFGLTLIEAMSGGGAGEIQPRRGSCWNSRSLSRARLSDRFRHKRIEVPAREQEARQPRGFRCLDIGRAVADDKTALAPHWPMLHQIEDHARARLSPVVVFEIAGNRSVGMMRAISDVIDDGALRGEFGAHPVVQRAQFVLGKEAARHA